MDLNIKTKFELGQEVFICRKEMVFKEGKYVKVYVPDPEPYHITSIRTHTYPEYQSIYYRLDGHQVSYPEKWVYASYEEAVNNN
jgi:hypothetical protein